MNETLISVLVSLLVWLKILFFFVAVLFSSPVTYAFSMQIVTPLGGSGGGGNLIRYASKT